MVYLNSGYFRRPLISKSLLRHPGDAELRASLAGPALGGVLFGPGRPVQRADSSFGWPTS